jgi:hypothetical protein
MLASNKKKIATWNRGSGWNIAIKSNPHIVIKYEALYIIFPSSLGSLDL